MGVGHVVLCWDCLPIRKMSLKLKSTTKIGLCVEYLVMMLSMVESIRCRSSSSDGMYMWMRSKGVRGLLVMLIIWRYGDNSS